MPIVYRIDETDSIIIEVWRGDVSIDTLVEHWREYVKDDEVMRLRRTLVDLREATIAFTADELAEAIMQVVVPALDGRDWVTAIVVKHVDQFRVGAQYQSLAMFYSYDSIFSNVPAATEWLLKQELRIR